MSVQADIAASSSPSASGGMHATQPMIPESAPFSPEQRAWLNGFFAGLLSLDAKAGAAALDGAMPDAGGKGAGQRGRRRALARCGHAASPSAWRWQKASRCRAACSPPWRSRIAASAATCARPTRRPSPRARSRSSTCARPAARRRAAC